MPSDQMHKLAELMKVREELHPELARYKCSTEAGFFQIKHPLSYILLYIPELNAVYNEAYLHKFAFRERARQNRRWHDFINVHERAWRLDALETVKAEMTDSAYWSILGGIWSDSENLYQFGDLIPTLVNDPRPHRERMMYPRERKLLASLPETVVVYRGHQGKNKVGWSWSLSHWKARWFARREDPKRQQVIRGVVSKSDIIAVLMRRGEFECIVDPSKVKNPRSFPMTIPQHYVAIATDGLDKNLVDGPSSFHGISHWFKVDWNVQRLCRLNKDADIAVCRWFAYLHDSRRINDKDDPVHGERAAAYAEQLDKAGRLGALGTAQIKKLVTAIRDHEKGTVSDDPTIGVCWDADRLDLMRVGIVPDPNLLSTATAKELLWML